MQATLSNPKRTLLDIMRDIAGINEEAYENFGELTDDMMQELDNLQEEFTKKVDSTLWVADKIYSLADMMRERAKRLTEASRVYEGRGDRLREWVKVNMERSSIKTLSTERYPVVAVRAKPASVEVDELVFFAEADPALVRIKKEPDKTAIKKRLQDGETVKGATLKTGTRLEVR